MQEIFGSLFMIVLGVCCLAVVFNRRLRRFMMDIRPTFYRTDVDEIFRVILATVVGFFLVLMGLYILLTFIFNKS